MTKQFLYLVQSAAQLPAHYEALQSAQSDRIILTWKEEVEGAIYFPKSTWTQGRNRLLQEALEQPDYLYYIFLDDDVVFEKGDWRTFEDSLLKYEPAIATPYYPEYKVAAVLNDLDVEAHTCRYFDAMFNAFHRDLIKDGLVLPYCGKFDAESWWYSQWFVVQLAALFYSKYTLQINSVWINNTKHGEYPQADEYKKVQKWFEREVLKPKSVGGLTHILWNKILYRRPSLAGPRPPAPKPPSYRVSRRRRHRKLNLRSEFWAK